MVLTEALDVLALRAWQWHVDGLVADRRGASSPPL